MCKEIIIVVGRLCSGKSYFIDKVLTQDYPNSEVIRVGDIARALKKSEDRIIDESLDNAIIEELLKKIRKTSTPTLIIDGIRQFSIYQAVKRFALYSNIFVKSFLCVADYIRRKQRYAARKDAKDSKMSFESADFQDKLLFKELEEFAETWFIKIKLAQAL